MSNHNIQYVTLEGQAGVDLPIIYCPFCGKATVDDDGHTYPCGHLEFIFLPELDEMSFCSDNFEPYVEELDFFDFQDDAKDQLMALDINTPLLVLEILTGPPWFPAIFAFSFKEID